jgi:hypothetical protein
MAFNIFATATSDIPLANLDANFTMIGSSAVASTLYPTATTSITYGTAGTSHIFSGSIGAFTLSGTVSGGGNQLNNVIIGTTTPLAGKFTTLSAAGTVTIDTAASSSLVWKYSGTSIAFAQLYGPDSEFDIGTSANGPVLLYSNNTERMRIFATGNTRFTPDGTNTVGTFSSTGLAVTGTLSATGLISAPAGVEIGSTAIANQTVKLWRGTAGEYGTVGVTGNGLNLNAQQGYVNLQLAGVDKVVLSSTGLAVTGTLSSTLDATIYGLTVGRGGGAVSTNTAVGASALASTTSGASNSVIGYEAGKLNTTGAYNTFSGYQAGYSNTAGYGVTAIGFQAAYATNNTSNTYQGITAIGMQALYKNTSGGTNIAIGGYDVGSTKPALYENTIGSYNLAIGTGSLSNNLSASNNTGLGHGTLYYNSTGANNTAVGYQALVNNTASNNTAVGYQAGYYNTAAGNVFIGYTAGFNNIAALYNTFVGYEAAYSNTAGVYNTVLGYQAGKYFTGGGNLILGSRTLGSSGTPCTGNYNTLVGDSAGAVLQGASTNNTFVGNSAGNIVNTGSGNQFFGTSSGGAVTSGSKNVILGSYTGSAAPISATGNNYVVLSDGDGTPRGYFDSSGIYYVLGTNGQILCGTTTSSGSFGNSTGGASISFYGATHATVPNKVTVTPGTNGVYMNSGATAWTAISDERFKDIIEPISDAVTKVSSLRAVIGKFKTDEKNVRRSFLIAQDVQAVLPEAIDATNPDQLGVAYTDVIPLLVAAIKELSAKVTALENK